MNENKNIKTYSLIGAICSIICGIYFFVHPFSYDATIISIYYMVLCVLPYIMIAVLLLLRKKHVMWLIPSGICLYQTFRQWHWFLFDDTLDCAVAICLILAQTILFIILLCNTIPALEKKAMAINEVLWFVPAFLMLIGYIINIFNYYTITNYFIGNIMNLRLFTSSKSKLTVFPSGKKCSLSSAIQATSRKLLHLFNVSWILQNFICGFPLNSSYFVSE